MTLLMNFHTADQMDLGGLPGDVIRPGDAGFPEGTRSLVADSH